MIDGVHQRADDGRVGAGAIERDLDGKHVGVGRGPLEEIHRAAEILIGMMHEHVAPPDGIKEMLHIAQPFGFGGEKRRIAQFRRVVAFTQH